MQDDRGEILWTPPSDIRDTTRIGRWLGWLETECGLRFSDYNDVWKWSVEDLDAFWRSIWEHFELIAQVPPERTLASDAMPGAVWMPGVRLNYAENALRRAPEGVAVVARSQTREGSELTGQQLRDQVARARTGLLKLGVGRGDRVVAYAPNIPETLILFLAAASIGAVFSSCPPEFGPKAVLDRFAQIEPTVLLCVDGYRHRGRDVSRRDEVNAIRDGLPTLNTTVTLPYLEDRFELADGVSWAELTETTGELAFEPVPFEHPLYVVYSSGTTGLPKPIIHAHGGILIEHTKVHALHHDLGPGDRFFWYSTTGWIMWNYLVSGLLVGSSIVLWDGDPGYPDLETLWALAQETGVTVFGASAPFLMSCLKADVAPGQSFDLSRIRQVGSTGAPLPADGFRWVYSHVKDDVVLVSISGGTDLASGIVAGVSLLPVRAGEITCRCLGVKAEAFNDDGTSVIGGEGYLVVTKPMPSMPVGLWGDTDGSRYRAAYFERFPGIWEQGDWVTISPYGTVTITGRSDATLNRGGVRLGTSDFYGVVEKLPEIADSLVVHLEEAGSVGELLLFVQLAPGYELDDALRSAIATRLRTALSPRHVPDDILAVPSVPKTMTGKKLEVPVKRILSGTPASEAASKDSLADPLSLNYFQKIASDYAR
ncbi:acetoacetate--CoA ligase [Mycolicibacterium septicum]|uniref:acetoacetate--CoA ligase n=1 Tax=Mycolicibacterium septicum TaxID=98668 RepID=UPI00235E4FB1|nr:acetoacetate--CoA ligase [Mycolicibacterium septicum]